MAGLALGVFFFGYSVVYYGITQVEGGNFGFLDLVLPSRIAKLSTIRYDDGHMLGTSSTGTSTKVTPSAGSSTVAQKEKAGVPANVVKSPAISFRPTPGR